MICPTLKLSSLQFSIKFIKPSSNIMVSGDIMIIFSDTASFIPLLMTTAGFLHE